MIKAPNQRYEHDCSCCEFLGQAADADVYYCPEQKSVILRSGDEGPEYASFPLFIARRAARQDASVTSAQWALAVALVDAR